MIQAMIPYSTTAKTAEIMARYRPIAPKPETPADSSTATENQAMSQTIQRSPYLRNVWANLQERPTRTRKRGRTSFAPAAVKRQRTCLQGLSPPYQGFSHVPPNSLPQLTSLPSLAGLNCSFMIPTSNPANSAVTLPLLRCTSPPESDGNGNTSAALDLNSVSASAIPEEKDLLQQLQGPTTPGVIAPRPIRPVGSTITVGCITDDPEPKPGSAKKPEEVETEVESEALPTVVSDWSNRVRLANSAYREMVGQPECPWLGSMGGSAFKRIGGEVMIQFLDPNRGIRANGFSGWARIEWGQNGKKKLVNAFCEVGRLACESKDYVFAWRFHTREASESASNV